MRYLTVDGMLSGPGIRDTVNGGYLEHEELDLSPTLSNRISMWLAEYEKCHCQGFQNTKQITDLDTEGIEISRLLNLELPDSKVVYFSNAKMINMSV